jgi:hypothetical protein
LKVESYKFSQMSPPEKPATFNLPAAPQHSEGGQLST